MAREKAERDKILEKKRKVFLLINSGITTYSPGQRHQVHSKRVSCLEGSWRWKEKEEEMIAR